MAADLPAELLAKDKRIDDLIEQAAGLVANLTGIAADLKLTLAAAQANLQAQQQISADAKVSVDVHLEGGDG